MTYDSVFFDLDGTILNTIVDLNVSMNYALEKHGFEPKTLEETRKAIGNGIRKLVERCVPEDCDPGAADRIYREFNEHYLEHCLDQTKPYDGIKEILEKLHKKGIPVAVVTNKNDTIARKMISLVFGEEVLVTQGAVENVPKKPATDMVDIARNALKEKGYAINDAIYIGDSEVDIMTAKNAGMKGISVTWGFKTKEFLEKHEPEVMCDTAEELKKALGL